MNKDILKNKKALSSIISTILALILIILFFSTDCLAMLFHNKEYKVYKYAIECVEDDLKFPNTATYPSFKDTQMTKSNYTTEIIIGSHSIGSPVGGKSIKYAWDVSGSGTCENALGMKLNYNFTVTVVEDENGDFWCYKCIVN